MTLIGPTLQAFFTDRLTKQLHASPRTIASYRDTLRLLLCFAHDRTGTTPSAIDWNDLDEPLIAAFLEHLETERHNSARTQNLRLTAMPLTAIAYFLPTCVEYSPSRRVATTVSVTGSRCTRAEPLRVGAGRNEAGPEPVRRAGPRRDTGAEPVRRAHLSHRAV